MYISNVLHLAMTSFAGSLMVHNLCCGLLSIILFFIFAFSLFDLKQKKKKKDTLVSKPSKIIWGKIVVEIHHDMMVTVA